MSTSPSLSRPPFVKRVQVPLVVCLVLAGALVWALVHMRYTRPPARIDTPTSFVVPPTKVGHESTTRPPANPLPTHLYIPSRRIAAAIVEEPPTSSTRVPIPPPHQVGRYVDGGRLTGAHGTVLLVGHVVYNGVRGALWNLRDVSRGTDVWTSDAQDRLTHWRVYGRVVVDKDSSAWPVGVYNARGVRRLAIVTCTGDPVHIPGRGYHFSDNLIVYATPVS